MEDSLTSGGSISNTLTDWKMVDSHGRKISSSTVEHNVQPVFKLPRPKNRLCTGKGDNQERPQNGVDLLPDETAWDQQKARINRALLWLKSEMQLLRIHDKLLEAKFLRVQSRIDGIRKDREEMRKRRRSVSFDPELDEEEGHWEDWEIKEFDEAHKQQCELSLDSQLSAVSKEVRNVGLHRLKQQQQQLQEQQQQQLQQQQQQHKTRRQTKQLQQRHIGKPNGIRLTLPTTEPKIFVL